MSLHEDFERKLQHIEDSLNERRLQLSSSYIDEQVYLTLATLEKRVIEGISLQQENQSPNEPKFN
jgi:hypothetical protein